MTVNEAKYPLGHLVPGYDKWRTVHEFELEDWLKAYPRPLEPIPPLSHGKASVRWWRDPTLGDEHHGDVAMLNKSRGSSFCQVLKVIP